MYERLLFVFLFIALWVSLTVELICVKDAKSQHFSIFICLWQSTLVTMTLTSKNLVIEKFYELNKKIIQFHIFSLFLSFFLSNHFTSYTFLSLVVQSTRIDERVREELERERVNKQASVEWKRRKIVEEVQQANMKAFNDLINESFNDLLGKTLNNLTAIILFLGYYFCWHQSSQHVWSMMIRNYWKKILTILLHLEARKYNKCYSSNVIVSCTCTKKNMKISFSQKFAND